MENEQAKRTPASLAAFGDILTALFVMALIFGDGQVALTVLALAVLLAALPFLSEQLQRNLSTLMARPGSRTAVALVIPLFVLAGIFGTPSIMIQVLIIAALALSAAMLTVRTGLSSVPETEVTKAPTTVPALPAESSGEIIADIDIRALCRGLPPGVAGQVVATIEHLETVAAKARHNGETRRSYDARQGLTDYLPNTINAWKAQDEAQRDLSELERALEQVREIAGAHDSGGEAGRRAWETQQRFLASRKGKLE